MPDSMLRTVLKEMKQLSKVRKTIKKTKRKTRRKESQAAINRRMAKVRAAKNWVFTGIQILQTKIRIMT